MAIRLEDICPNCGSHLMIRDGEYGEFLACPRFPACKFTKPLPDYDLKIYQPPSPYCEKCNHTGLIPFINKAGKSIPHTFVDCECREEEHEYYREVQPEDFDFPMSYDFYRSLCYQHGWPDPGSCELPEAKPKEPSISPTRSLTPKEWDELQQVKAKVLFLQDKLNKLLDTRKVAKQEEPL